MTTTPLPRPLAFYIAFDSRDSNEHSWVGAHFSNSVRGTANPEVMALRCYVPATLRPVSTILLREHLIKARLKICEWQMSSFLYLSGSVLTV